MIVEDETSIHGILKDLLEKENYDTIDAYSGTEALMLLEKNSPDLLLLDLMLPGLNGEAVIERANHIPIIVLSAKVDPENKVECLLKGANDYITKPFDRDELLARIKVQLRMNDKNNSLEYKDLKLEKDNHTLLVKGKKVNLTKTEYAIIKQLLLNVKNVVTKSKLLDLIATDTEDCNEDSLRVHMSNIRRKIRLYSEEEYIESIWGVGFKIKE